MKAIIVDDEPKAISLLRGYLDHFSNIELVSTFRNGLKAFEFLSKEKVDLIFLDINMPNINGLSLSKMISKDVKVIFTTAYSEYAVESYEVQATDYLLKPIGFERFTKAISKVLSEKKQIKPLENKSIVLLKSGSKTHRINPNEINYIEKDGNYSTYHMTDLQKIITRESVSETLSKLPSSFLQVHKSYIVNMESVSGIEKDILFIKNLQIPIGGSFKQDTLKKLLN